MQLKLKIESNISLDLSPLNWREVRKQANKISVCANGSAIATIKDRGIPSKYIYDINYEPTGIDIKKSPTDAERIAQLEQEVAKLKAEKSPQEYFIWDFSNVTDHLTGEQLWWRMPLSKECPFYTIERERQGNFVVKNTVTGRLYNVPVGQLKYREEYVEWKRVDDKLQERLSSYLR